MDREVVDEVEPQVARPLSAIKYFLVTWYTAIIVSLSKILAFLTTEGHPFLGSWLQWIRIRAGKSDQELLSRNKGRVESKDLITGRFLGQGCSGIFYETTWSLQKIICKIRLARKDFPGVKSDIFVAEAVRLFALHDHPNIVKTFCWTVDNRSCSLVMEYMKDDLSSFMRKKKEALRKEGVQAVTPFQLLEALDILSQIATGVEYLHGKGICHGDLKPNNVMIDWKEGRMVVKVADFGLAEIKRNSSLISQRAVWFRMLEWSAPEVFAALCGSMSEDLDLASDPSSSNAACSENCQNRLLEMADSYSFGLTSAYILGSKMWSAKLSPNELRKQMSSLGLRPELPSECPKALATLMRSCWNPDPSHRPTFSFICMKLEAIVKEWQQRLQIFGAMLEHGLLNRVLNGGEENIELGDDLEHNHGVPSNKDDRNIKNRILTTLEVPNSSKKIGVKMENKWPDNALANDEEGTEEHKLPIHLQIQQGYAKNTTRQYFLHETYEGEGHALKRRDLRQMQNALLRQTGFFDG